MRIRDMETSISGMLEIIAHEGVVLNRYQDVKGVWTIGMGVTAMAGAEVNPNTFHGEITEAQAFEMFRKLLPQYEGYVHKLLENAGVTSIKQHEFDALVSLSWNVGGILTVESKTRGTRARIARGDVAGAIDLWRADRDLWRRRNKEVALARTGIYPSRTTMVARAGEYGEVLRGSAKRVSLRKFSTEFV